MRISVRIEHVASLPYVPSLLWLRARRGREKEREGVREREFASLVGCMARAMERKAVEGGTYGDMGHRSYVHFRGLLRSRETRILILWRQVCASDFSTSNHTSHRPRLFLYPPFFLIRLNFVQLVGNSNG